MKRKLSKAGLTSQPHGQDKYLYWLFEKLGIAHTIAMHYSGNKSSDKYVTNLLFLSTKKCI